MKAVIFISGNGEINCYPASNKELSMAGHVSPVKQINQLYAACFIKGHTGNSRFCLKKMVPIFCNQFAESKTVEKRIKRKYEKLNY